jgi:hypothetical protein
MLFFSKYVGFVEVCRNTTLCLLLTQTDETAKMQILRSRNANFERLITSQTAFQQLMRLINAVEALNHIKIPKHD